MNKSNVTIKGSNYYYIVDILKEKNYEIEIIDKYPPMNKKF